MYSYTTRFESNLYHVALVHLRSLCAPFASLYFYRTRVGGRVDRARADHGSTGGVARRRVNVNTAYRRVETELPLRCFIALRGRPAIVITIGQIFAVHLTPVI